MSQDQRDEETVTRLRKAYAAYSRGDFDAVIEIAHPDIELVTTGGFTNLRGTDDFRAWMEPETLEDVVMEPNRFEVAGNSVLAFGHPMMGLGETALPTAISRVAWIMASTQRSFKMAEWWLPSKKRSLLAFATSA